MVEVSGLLVVGGALAMVEVSRLVAVVETEQVVVVVSGLVEVGIA